MRLVGRFAAPILVLGFNLATTARAQPAKQDKPPEQEGPTREQPANEDTTPAIEDHIPGKGVRLAHGGMGELTFSAYTTIRYLNQRLLDSTFTNSDGITIPRPTSP